MLPFNGLLSRAFVFFYSIFNSWLFSSLAEHQISFAEMLGSCGSVNGETSRNHCQPASRGSKCVGSAQLESSTPRARREDTGRVAKTSALQQKWGSTSSPLVGYLQGERWCNYRWFLVQPLPCRSSQSQPTQPVSQRLPASTLAALHMQTLLHYTSSPSNFSSSSSLF